VFYSKCCATVIGSFTVSVKRQQIINFDAEETQAIPWFSERWEWILVNIIPRHWNTHNSQLLTGNPGFKPSSTHFSELGNCSGNPGLGNPGIDTLKFLWIQLHDNEILNCISMARFIDLWLPATHILVKL